VYEAICDLDTTLSWAGIDEQISRDWQQSKT
jgi:hypothetical protein